MDEVLTALRHLDRLKDVVKSPGNTSQLRKKLKKENSGTSNIKKS